MTLKLKVIENNLRSLRCKQDITLNTIAFALPLKV